jgi:hypothetical protein
MLYKHERLEKKLREKGRSAPAEILAMRTEGRGNSARASWSNDDDLTTSWTLCRLELRVMPPGEPPFEATVRTRLNTWKTKGATVPVLYDPDDHDKVVVDYQSDARATMEGKPMAEDPELAALEALENTEGASAPASAESDRLDQLKQLADLHERGALTDAEFAAEKQRILNA